ncbi:MAG: rhodanese domain-containing protein, partial [Simkaniaceae bacterium]|nr:rhodanese domain-containing protein [Simkaniaceae bacterium]
MTYHVLAFYEITPIEDSKLFVKKMQEYLKDKDAKGRVYLADQGINGQM